MGRPTCLLSQFRFVCFLLTFLLRGIVSYQLELHCYTGVDLHIALVVMWNWSIQFKYSSPSFEDDYQFCKLTLEISKHSEKYFCLLLFLKSQSLLVTFKDFSRSDSSKIKLVLIYALVERTELVLASLIICKKYLPSFKIILFYSW